MPVHPRLILQRAELKYLEAAGWSIFVGKPVDPNQGFCQDPLNPAAPMLDLDDAVLLQKSRDPK